MGKKVYKEYYLCGDICIIYGIYMHMYVYIYTSVNRYICMCVYINTKIGLY